MEAIVTKTEYNTPIHDSLPRLQTKVLLHPLQIIHEILLSFHNSAALPLLRLQSEMQQHPRNHSINGPHLIAHEILLVTQKVRYSINILPIQIKNISVIALTHTLPFEALENTHAKCIDEFAQFFGNFGALYDGRDVRFKAFVFAPTGLNDAAPVGMLADHTLESETGGFVCSGKVAVEGFPGFLLEVGDYLVRVAYLCAKIRVELVNGRELYDAC